jgi:hypothetical protein
MHLIDEGAYIRIAANGLCIWDENPKSVLACLLSAGMDDHDLLCTYCTFLLLLLRTFTDVQYCWLVKRTASEPIWRNHRLNGPWPTQTQGNGPRLRMRCPSHLHLLLPLNHEFQIMNVKSLVTFQNLPSQISNTFPDAIPTLSPPTLSPPGGKKEAVANHSISLRCGRVAALRVSEFVTVRGVGTLSSFFYGAIDLLHLDLECQSGVSESWWDGMCIEDWQVGSWGGLSTVCKEPLFRGSVESIVADRCVVLFGHSAL